jgi:hypothetical protein
MGEDTAAKQLEQLNKEANALAPKVEAALAAYRAEEKAGERAVLYTEVGTAGGGQVARAGCCWMSLFSTIQNIMLKRHAMVPCTHQPAPMLLLSSCSMNG